MDVKLAETISMSAKPIEEPGSKCVVLLGTLTQEGVTTKLRSLGYYYHNKRLQGSNPPNWQAVTEFISARRAAGTLLGVFVDLTIGVFDLCRQDDYKSVWSALLLELKRVKTTIYVYEKTLLNDFEDSPWNHNVELNDAIRYVVKELQQAGLTILPFQKHHEVTTSIVQILEELDGGVLLRLYVPDKRYQSEQFDAFLRLLENYLRTVEKVSFTIDQRKTDHGLVYVFSSKRDISSAEEMDAAVTRFRDFMELCEQDASKAKTILAAASIPSSDAESILARYVRDYRRLMLDTKHEREQKLLRLRQELESEVLDSDFSRSLENSITFPSTSFLSLAGNSGPINITLTNSTIDSVNARYNASQIFNGDINFTEEDKRIIELVDKYSKGFEAATLKSALAELKDDSTPAEAKSTACQKVKGILYKAASIVGDAAVKGLASYLEKLIAGKP